MRPPGPLCGYHVGSLATQVARARPYECPSDQQVSARAGGDVGARHSLCKDSAIRWANEPLSPCNAPALPPRAATPGHITPARACPGWLPPRASLSIRTRVPGVPLPLGEAILAILGLARPSQALPGRRTCDLANPFVATRSAPWPLRLNVRVPTSVLLIGKRLRVPVVM